jgi:septin 3/9/12
LTPLDIAVMRKLSECANVIPVIGKSDSLTVEERSAFKKRIKEEIEYHGIRVYPGVEDEDEGREEKAVNAMVREMIPFAVVGSEVNVVVDGKSVRGRKTRAGVVNGMLCLLMFRSRESRAL